MLLPIEWLKDWIEVPEDLQALGEALTLSGSKVETMVSAEETIQHVVTGQILEITRHPDADKLVVCQIDVGQAQPLQIVTGATNVSPGQIVPVALNGAKLAGGLEIKTGRLRGVTSEGMLCSIEELGLSKSLYPEGAIDGIFILDPQTPIGQPVLEVLQATGSVFEFEITSNRPDCFSVEGLAREAAITLGQPFEIHQPKVQTTPGVQTVGALKVNESFPSACSRYCARRITNVKVEPSPFWMRKRLEQAGVRSINNLVDVTNYVMLELGQPLHAFSADQLEGHEICVRWAKPGEKLRLLDEQEVTLDAQDLVIADAHRPVALAGIMGGEMSGMRPDSTEVILEAAHFDPDTIRRTAARLKLRTESSTRFERGIDPSLCRRALDRACELIEAQGWGEVAEDVIDRYPHPKAPVKLHFDPKACNRFLGLTLSDSEMAEILTAVGCSLTRTEPVWTVEVPSWRPDLEGFADLTEEIARFYDYNRIPATLLPVAETTVGGRTTRQMQWKNLCHLLTGCGFYEAYTYSFMSPKELDRLGLPEDSPLRNLVRIRRAPEETSCLRSTALPALLNSLHHNSARGIPAARLFEGLRTYHPIQPGQLPEERLQLAVGLYDRNDETKAGERFFELKQVVHEIASQLGVKSLKLVPPQATAHLQAPAEAACFHPYRSAWITVRNQVVGLFGYLHPTVCRAYEVPRETAALLLTSQPVLEAANSKRSQKPLPKYPATTRDLAFVMRREIPVGDLEAILLKQGGNLLESLNLFDVYEGSRLENGYKSVAYTLIFRSPKGTLQDAEVNPIITRMIETAQKKLQAEVRDK